MHSKTQFDGNPGSMLEQNVIVNKPIGRRILKIQERQNLYNIR